MNIVKKINITKINNFIKKNQNIITFILAGILILYLIRKFYVKECAIVESFIDDDDGEGISFGGNDSENYILSVQNRVREISEQLENDGEDEINTNPQLLKELETLLSILEKANLIADAVDAGDEDSDDEDSDDEDSDYEDSDYEDSDDEDSEYEGFTTMGGGIIEGFLGGCNKKCKKCKKKKCKKKCKKCKNIINKKKKKKCKKKCKRCKRKCEKK